MGKFKVGDRVRVRAWNSMAGEFGVDKLNCIPCSATFTYAMLPYCGKITTVVHESDGEYLLDGCGNWIFTDDMLEAITEERKIIITTDGFEVVTAKLIEGETVREVKTKCYPHDVFDFFHGARIAVEVLSNGVLENAFEMLEKEPAEAEEEAEEEQKPLYNGCVVCVDNTNNPDGYTVGKMYQFIDGVITMDTGYKLNNKGGGFTSFEEFTAYTASKFVELVDEVPTGTAEAEKHDPHEALSHAADTFADALSHAAAVAVAALKEAGLI